MAGPVREGGFDSATGAAGPTVAPAPAATDPCLGRTVHPPIRIAEEEGPLGFILGYSPTGEPIYRPGSGVSAGTGTKEDPYVIEGWCILRQPTPYIIWQNDPVGAKDVTDNVTQSLMLDGTGSHVVIRDNVLPGTLNIWEVGILLEDAQNVTVAHNIITTMWRGIFLLHAHDNVVTGNTLLDSGVWGIALFSSPDNLVESNSSNGSGYGGFLVSESDRVTLAGNLAVANGTDGILVVLSSGVTVHDNTVADNRRGINLLLAQNATVDENTVRRSGTNGIQVGPNDPFDPGPSCRDVRIEDNDVAESGWNGVVMLLCIDSVVRDNVSGDNARNGIVLITSWQNEIEGNAVTDNALAGILLEGGGDGNEISGNEITRNREAGIEIQGAVGNVIRFNNLSGNAPPGEAAGLGLVAAGTPAVDATLNWWGCPAGPEGPGCDGVEGDVIYAPWLEEPNQTIRASDG